MRERGIPTQPITQQIIQAAIEQRPDPDPPASVLGRQMWMLAAVGVLAVLGCTTMSAALGWPFWAGTVIGAGAGAVVLWRARMIMGQITAQEAARLQAFNDLSRGHQGDTLTLPETHPEGELFNAALEAISAQLSEGWTQRNLLETVLDAAPLAVVVCDYRGQVVIANRTADDLLAQGQALHGQDFAAVLARCPDDMANAVRNQADELFTVAQGDQEQAYHVSTPFFDLNQHRYTMYLIKQLTKELSRQEVAIWKKMIRVISHELNNSLAPVSSLIHSARLVLDKPAHADKLVRIFDVIEDRTRHLLTFLEGYARFARLAPPERKPVEWGPFLSKLIELQQCRLIGETPEQPGWLDEAQIQQALINLIKNASESDSAPEEVALSVESTRDGGVRLSVLDRGRGMSDEVMHQALLPFYSTKKRSSGLGLSLCREIADAHEGTLRLERREGGGTAAHLWLPPRPKADSTTE
ncbi:MAG: sensor histidine kinase [Bradymonadia bacterium]